MSLFRSLFSKSKILPNLANSSSGQTGLLIPLLLMVIIVLALLPLIPISVNNLEVSNCEQLLGQEGYTILASGECDNIASLLDQIKDRTDNLPDNPASQDTLLGVGISTDNNCSTICNFHAHETFIFPDNVSKIVRITSNNATDTFSEWAEVVANDGTKISDNFISNGAFLSYAIYQDTTKVDNIYIVEFAYGDSKTVVSRFKILPSKDTSANIPLNSALIPEGETLYCRMKSVFVPFSIDISIAYYYYHCLE